MKKQQNYQLIKLNTVEDGLLRTLKTDSGMVQGIRAEAPEVWDDIAWVHCIYAYKKREYEVAVPRTLYYKVKNVLEKNQRDPFNELLGLNISNDDTINVPEKFIPLLRSVSKTRRKVEFTLASYPYRNMLVYSIAIANRDDKDNFDKEIGRKICKIRIVEYVREKFDWEFYDPKMISVEPVKVNRDGEDDNE